MLKGNEFHVDQLACSNDQICDLHNNQWLLIFRIIHAINREQELVGPIVVSYLMGWRDVICLHQYFNLYWLMFRRALVYAFPALEAEPGLMVQVRESSDSKIHLLSNLECFVIEWIQTTGSVDILQLDADNYIWVKNQVTNYECCGSPLDNMSIINFFKDTYKEQICHSDLEGSQTGCPWHLHVNYSLQHTFH